MAKVHVKTKLKNEEETHDFDGLGLLRDDQLIFYDEQVKMIIMLDDMKVIRENSESKIILDFKGSDSSSFELKSKNISVPIPCELSYLKKKENHIEIHYKIEDQLFKFYVEYEVLK